MQNDVSICTSDDDLNIKYGMINYGEERELARASVRYILSDMNDIRKSFVRLGFHLSEMLHMKYYEDFGYQSLEEFAENNLGMDKSNVYRYIRVYEHFAQSACTYRAGVISGPFAMELDDRWKNYSFSQLVEMCNMSDEQRKKCSPDMTIKQLREVKKDVPNEKVATSPQKDKSKEFSYDYCTGLHGAAQAAYVKSRVAKSSALIYIYDVDGKEVDPEISNLWMDLLYCKEGMYVFRLRKEK